MSQHYFIGIKIPPLIRNQVGLYQEKFRLHDFYRVIPHVEDLHLTLLYLGNVPDDNLAPLKRNLGGIAADHASMTLQVDGLSYFGSSSGPRVVYLSITESPELNTLQKKIVSDCTQLLNIHPEDRFVPHITIAKKRKTTDDPTITKETFQPIAIPAPTFSLFAIHPSESPKYEVIDTFTLN